MYVDTKVLRKILLDVYARIKSSDEAFKEIGAMIEAIHKDGWKSFTEKINEENPNLLKLTVRHKTIAHATTSVILNSIHRDGLEKTLEDLRRVCRNYETPFNMDKEAYEELLAMLEEVSSDLDKGKHSPT